MASDETLLRDTALRLLNRREYSADELCERLRLRGFTADASRNVVVELSTAGLQSDERYAQMLVRHRVRQGYGPVRIRAELRQRGVAEGVIAAALSSSDVEWDAVAHRVHEKRVSTSGVAADRFEQARDQRFLLRRGFTSSQIRQAVNGASDED